MPNQKKVLFCVFEPDDPKSTEQMRQMFIGSYPIFSDMEAVEYKCWWVDEDRGQWGAVFGLEVNADPLTVPVRYLIQTRYQMWVSGAKWGALAVQIGMDAPVRYWHVEPDPMWEAAFREAPARWSSIRTCSVSHLSLGSSSCTPSFRNASQRHG